MSLPQKLTLQAWAPEIEGCGAELEVKFLASQRTKAGNVHRTHLVLRVDRYLVRQLAEQVAAMHKRDLERIERERARLHNEIAPLLGVKPP